jgi:signal transduction histidine kinase
LGQLRELVHLRGLPRALHCTIVAEAQPSHALQVLLVEDDGSIRTTLADMLRDEGFRVTPVANGREALSHLRRAAPPDVIVLDLMMPVMDGWEFRVEQKSDPALASIPVVAMSADVSAKARAIGADGYVRKPIDFADLMRSVRNVVEQDKRQRLAAADRMAALGTLASGIAHEINNPLTFVLANLTDLQHRVDGMPDGGELRELVGDTLQGAERIRRIVKQTQMVAPLLPEQRETVVDLRAALETAIALIENEVRHRARLLRELGEPVHVRGDRGRIEQLFLNLLLNAAQAVPEGHVPDNEIRVTLRSLPSARALIEVADTGSGIRVEVQERIFQPFFTTKPVGQGTGLGLSICHGIVSALGGEISFQSEPGRGTVFRVLLPTVAATATTGEGVGLRAGSARPSLRQRSVLAIDNEPSILRVIRQILEPPHKVTTALDAESALAVIRSASPFDVVICELMLPGTSGMDFFEELQRSAPDTAARVLFMTAGAFTPRARHFLETLGHRWLSKPFDREQLIAAIGAGPDAAGSAVTESPNGNLADASAPVPIGG